MRKIIMMFAALALLAACNSNTPEGENWKVVDGMIEFDVPAAEAGQQDMLGFAAEPIDTVRVAFVGLGARGSGAVERYTYIDGVKIVALCDKYPEKVEEQQKVLADAGLPAAASYSGEDGWKEMFERDDIDLVYICTNWQMHVPMAIYAMEHGKHVACEVPIAYTVEDCWKLVNTSEKTRKHCMMLENCVYDFFEMTALNMAQQGLFGEVIHTEGAYIHNLEPFWDRYADNWRMEFNQANGGDVYPTHGFGPCCNVLNIHRGDKLDYLVSMSTPSYNGKARAEEKMGVDSYACGDHQVTLIMTEKGKCMEVQHNVYTPRPYNRMYQITGTEGFANKYPTQGITLRNKNISDAVRCGHESIDEHSFVPDDVFQAIMAEYQHPIHKEIGEVAKKVGGHGGMDFVMDYRLIYCLRHGYPLDEDVYDAAEWCCVGELSAVSEANGSMPVRVPDFTRGNWNKLDGLKFWHE
ncbi:MAG: Gfo/Idh/MocA family oxidoreductase [Bacteroidales bacterium]|nr:Gfo/Idh/MocA family oxidoreductase [Candidatus Equibacterium intestinale]